MIAAPIALDLLLLTSRPFSVGHPSRLIDGSRRKRRAPLFADLRASEQAPFGRELLASSEFGWKAPATAPNLIGTKTLAPRCAINMLRPRATSRARGRSAQMIRPPKVTIEMGSHETIKRAVTAGLGLSLISPRTIASEVAAKRIAVLKVEGLRLPSAAAMSCEDRSAHADLPRQRRNAVLEILLVRGTFRTRRLYSFQNPDSQKYDRAHRNPVRGHMHQIGGVNQAADHDCESNRIKAE